MKVLITGGSGKLARYVIRELEGAHELVLFSRSRPPEDRAHLPWIPGDLTRFDDCLRAVQGVDAIQHLAAMPYPTDHPAIRQRMLASGQDVPPPDATLRTNILGTYYLLQAAIQAGVSMVVMSGSNCALGHGFRISRDPFPIEYLPIDEEHPSAVEDSYSYSKLAGEELLASFTRAYGIRTYVTRPSGICPPERREAMARNARPADAWNEWLWGWIASEDLARMHRLIMESADALPPHDVYFANAADTTALEPTLELIQRFRPDLLSKVRHLEGHQAFFSCDKARQALRWQPRITWREHL